MESTISSVKKLKILVIGIDGASHSIVARMIASGDLPNMARLATQGGFGPLQATFPPHTAPGWASMFTGVQPGEHGIFQFWSTQATDYSSKGMNSGDFAREPIWKSLERNGLSVGAYNIPMTHPPAKMKNGYMISWPLSKTLRYSDPPELISELARKGLHYHSDVISMYRGQEDYLNQTKSFIRNKVKTCHFLQSERPVDAMILVFTEIDRISHYFWGDEVLPGQTVLDAYKEIDTAVGDLLDLTDEETLVVIASDHGFCLCEKDFNVHYFLEQAGLLQYKYVPLSTVNGLASDDTDSTDWFTSQNVYKKKIDWEKTKVYMPTPGCFGLNINLADRNEMGIVQQNQVDAIVDELKNRFAEFVTPEGKPYFELRKGKDIYQGCKQDEAPDLLLVPENWRIMPSVALEDTMWSTPTQRGVHEQDGILFVKGSSFPKGETLTARIEDVYPTLLAHSNLPVPEKLDGHWLVEPKDSVKRESAVIDESGRKLTNKEKALLDTQLQSIGYF
ncbi:MAG: alkaline phosphatase family protein [Aestuariibacter sp.]